MSQRLQFIQALLEERAVPFATLCQRVGISEKTGRKWRARFLAEGPAGLADRSHAPHVAPHQVPRALVERLVALRRKHKTWGARKLRQRLLRDEPTTPWPAPSTITTVLKREGLIRARRPRPRARSAWCEGTLTQPEAPNDVWACDFKGEFRLARGPYCYPLTISDLAARFVLVLDALPSVASAPVQAAFAQAFATYGLPRVIRSDNGVPFGQPNALGGLSALAVWWLHLGIRPERIARGRPQQNGCHERMHRTLAAEATRPPAASFAAQQARFEAWRTTFNTERPHEALGQTPPALHYVASARRLPRTPPPFVYPAAAEVRRVDPNGVIKYKQQTTFLSSVLAGEYVALMPVADGFAIALGPLHLGAWSLVDDTFTEQLRWLADPQVL
jgi:transposase InsO family protein